MSDEPSYILEISGLPESGGGANEGQPSGQAGGRPWIGMHFECCGVYTRIYRNRDGTAYEGHCPRCHRVARVKIGAGGTSHRMFRAE